MNTSQYIFQSATLIITIGVGVIAFLIRASVFDSMKRIESSNRELWIEHNSLRERMAAAETEIKNIKEQD